LLNFIEDTLNDQINKIQKNYQSNRTKKQTSHTPDKLYDEYKKIIDAFNHFTDVKDTLSNFESWKTGKKPFDKINFSGDFSGGGVNKNKNKNKNSKKTQKCRFRNNLHNIRNITKKHRKVYV
jgi:hypothetical protein